MIPWHRLFGLTLTDFFLNSAYDVQLEKDLSLKQQLLDVVIIEKKEGKTPENLPDGLENLAAHNLMTYKSHQEPLDGWAIEELCGHYVNYRKQLRPSSDKLPPAEDFRLYGISTRYPEKLAEQIALVPRAQGVYDVQWGTRTIRVIVLSRIEKAERNAPWLMFSAESEKVKFGAACYRWHIPISGVINKLFRKYQQEGVMIMPYTVEDYQREVKEEVLKSLTEEDLDFLFENIKLEDMFKRFFEKYQKEGAKKIPYTIEGYQREVKEDVLKSLSEEDMDLLLKNIKLEELFQRFKPEDRMKGLKPEEIEEYLKKIKK